MHKTNYETETRSHGWLVVTLMLIASQDSGIFIQ